MIPTFRMVEAGLFETHAGDDVHGVLLAGPPVAVREAAALLGDEVEVVPAGTVARLTAERDAAIKERDALREGLREIARSAHLYGEEWAASHARAALTGEGKDG